MKHTHRLHTVSHGWVFGTIGPAVKHAAAYAHKPRGWVWFCTDRLSIVCAKFQTEKL